MAAKKTAKKAAKKKAVKKEAPEKVKKKTTPEKVAEKVVKRAKKAKAPSKRTKVTEELSPKAANLVAKYDQLEVESEDLKDKQQAILKELREELGTATFIHPEREASMTIQCRNDQWFMRGTPTGRS